MNTKKAIGGLLIILMSMILILAGPLIAQAATPLTNVSISGTPAVGIGLVALPAPSGSTATYKWYYATTAGGTYSQISGATSASYVPASTYVGDYIEVTATGASSSGTVTSPAVGPVAAQSSLQVYCTPVTGYNAVTLSYGSTPGANWITTDSGYAGTASVYSCNSSGTVTPSLLSPTTYAGPPYPYLTYNGTFDIPASENGYANFDPYIPNSTNSIAYIEVVYQGATYFFPVTSINLEFLCAQMPNENEVTLSDYCPWPNVTYYVQTEGGGDWDSVVTAYDANKNALGTIDAPPGANNEAIGITDYSAYATRGIKYIQAVQNSTGDYVSIYFPVAITEQPALITPPTAAPGTAGGTTALTAAPNNAADNLAVEVSTISINTPNVGDSAPTGTGVTNPYTSGNNISAAAGDYAGVFELGSSGTVVAFSQIGPLTTGQIKASGSGSGSAMFTIAFNANGESGTPPASITDPSGTQVTLPGQGNLIAPQNYEFEGWNTAADGSGTSYTANSSYTINGNVTLYAQYNTPPYAQNTGFITAQIPGQNEIKVSTYSTWLGTGNPADIWPIYTDVNDEWQAQVSAYNASKVFLGYIDVPTAADGVVDYSAYVSKEIQYIKVTQQDGSDSGYITVTVISSGSINVTSTTGTMTISPATGGTASLGSAASVIIPPGALQGSADAVVAIQQVSNPPVVPDGFSLLGDIYEFTVGGQASYKFTQDVTLTFAFDPTAVQKGETPAVYYYDEATGQWVDIGGTVSGSTITVTVKHFTEFAVLEAPGAQTPVATVTKTKAPAVPPCFNDVSVSCWAYHAIEGLSSLGCISGYTDGSFKPNASITRAEFVSIIDKALKLNAYIPAVPDFSDVAKGDWFCGSVESAVYAGIIKGFGGDFKPNMPITREEMAVILVNALNEQGPAQANMGATTTFMDAAGISSWARGSVARAVKDGLLKGYPDNSFKPQGNATRAEVCAMIMNFLGMRK